MAIGGGHRWTGRISSRLALGRVGQIVFREGEAPVELAERATRKLSRSFALPKKIGDRFYNYGGGYYGGARRSGLRRALAVAVVAGVIVAAADDDNRNPITAIAEIVFSKPKQSSNPV